MAHDIDDDRMLRDVLRCPQAPVDLAAIEGVLKWEPSRGGALFPYLYGALPVSAVTRVQAMSVSDTGEVTLGAGAA